MWALFWAVHADVAQLVEHHLAKVRVAGSNPVVRSTLDFVGLLLQSEPGLRSRFLRVGEQLMQKIGSMVIGRRDDMTVEIERR